MVFTTVLRITSFPDKCSVEQSLSLGLYQMKQNTNAKVSLHMDKIQQSAKLLSCLIFVIYRILMKFYSPHFNYNLK